MTAQTNKTSASDPALFFKARYGNYINGQWVEPVGGQYFENFTPVTGRVLCEVPRSQAADIELALDAAYAAFGGYKHGVSL